MILTARRIYRFFALGDRLYSMRAERLDSMTGVSSVDLASNQSRDFKVVARAVRCDAFCPAETPTLLSSRVSRLRWLVLPRKSLDKLLHKVWLRNLADFNAEVPWVFFER